MSDSKQCTRCETTKAFEDFPTNPRMRDGRDSHCRQCCREKSRASKYKRTGREVPGGPKACKPPGQVFRDEDGAVTARECMDCHEIKPRSEFPQNRSLREGRVHAYCRPCQSSRGKESRIRVHGDSREYHLRHRYGIGSADHDAMFAAQNGFCGICGVRPAKHVDHDHVTGAVRALLCFTCNVGLGNFGDDPHRLRLAAGYLDRWAPHVQAGYEQTRKGVFRLVAA